MTTPEASSGSSNHISTGVNLSNKPTDAEMKDFLKELLSYSQAGLSDNPKDPAQVRAGLARCMNEAKKLLLRLAPATYKSDFDRSVVSLDLPVRLSNTLVKENILTVGDLIKLNEIDLLKLPGFGRNSLIFVRVAVAEYGGLKEYVPRSQRDGGEPVIQGLEP
jgi:DNA-directed RNA polymerase alpha subunit